MGSLPAHAGPGSAGHPRTGLILHPPRAESLPAAAEEEHEGQRAPGPEQDQGAGSPGVPALLLQPGHEGRPERLPAARAEPGPARRRGRQPGGPEPAGRGPTPAEVRPPPRSRDRPPGRARGRLGFWSNLISGAPRPLRGIRRVHLPAPSGGGSAGGASFRRTGAEGGEQSAFLTLKPAREWGAGGGGSE